jgi:hypothetical protein
VLVRTGKVSVVSELTDEETMQLALRAAAYVRWVELRSNRTPGVRERHMWITGLLKAANAAAADNEVYAIDAHSLMLPVEEVEQFARELDYFGMLDRVDARVRDRDT